MSYILRFVQQYHPSDASAFLELEAKFTDLELRTPQFPQGKRYQPLAAGEPTNTLIWECELESLADVQNALEKIADNAAHTKLFEKQSKYIVGARTEVYKMLKFQ